MSLPWKPARYQMRAVKFMLSRQVAGLLLDPGLRKTSITLAAFKVLQRDGIAQRMLVIAPLRPCYHVWPAEIAKWRDFQHLKVAVLHGDKKDKLLARGDADVYVINPEGLPWLLRNGAIGRRFFDVLVVDESTKFKDTRTQRFRLLKPLLGMFKRRYILTGTPTPKSLLDLFAQIYLLDRGQALGAYITHYRSRWFSPSGYGGYTWVPNDNADHEIAQRTTHLVLRMSEREYLQLPRLYTAPELPPIYIDLPHNARRAYDEMENLLITNLQRREVTAANAAVASMKCRQIANGGLYVDDSPGDGSSRKFTNLHDEKVTATMELLEQLQGKPALVAYDFHHDLSRLHKALGKHTPVLPAASPKHEARIIDAWNKGDTPVLLANPQSVAHGLNLQGGRAVVWHSLTWNCEHYDQFIRRVYRSGQTRTVFVYHIIARNTVDEVMLQVVEQRQRDQQTLFKLLQHYAAARRRSKPPV